MRSIAGYGQETREQKETREILQKHIVAKGPQTYAQSFELAVSEFNL